MGPRGLDRAQLAARGGPGRQGVALLAAGVRVWKGGAGQGAEFKEPGRAWRAEPRKILET